MCYPNIIQRLKSGLAAGLVLAAASPLVAAPAVSPVPSDVNGPAYLRTWSPAVCPPELLRRTIDVEVIVRAIVDATGHVSSARVLKSADVRFDESALAAVKTWAFEPALDDGKPVACCLDISVEFSATGAARETRPGSMPRRSAPEVVAAPRTTAEPLAAPLGTYPAVLLERKLVGRVQFTCAVSPEGRALAPRITGATHVDFVLPALEAMKVWKFTPAMQGDLPVESQLSGEVSFDAIGGSRDEMLAVNGITAPDGSAPADVPEPLVVADPVWPADLLLAGEGGSAAVEFTVGETGRVRDIRVREASRPEFGWAVAAALEMWLFEPALSGGKVVAVPLLKKAEFRAVPKDAPPGDDVLARLIGALRAGQIGTAKGLDTRLEPICRVGPVYPKALREHGRPTGRADIDVVIDREGRARLPKIASATREEFGWAAATAAAQWVFKVPMRAGHPVDVRVRIPFEFSAPEE